MSIKIKNNDYVGLPSGYTQLEYLVSDGTQYIDTRINPADKKIGAVVEFQFTDNSRNSGGVYGSNKLDNYDNCQFTVYTSKWRIKVNDYATYGATYDTNRHTARCNMPDGTRLDDTVYTSTQYTISSNNTKNVFIGACNYGNGTTYTYTLIGKLYSAKVYDDTTLVRNFIPAKNSSNVLGMYDTVTNTFFTNAGTGSFTAGNEVSPYKEIHELYKNNNGSSEYIGELYKKGRGKNLFYPVDKQGTEYPPEAGILNKEFDISYLEIGHDYAFSCYSGDNNVKLEFYNSSDSVITYYWINSTYGDEGRKYASPVTIPTGTAYMKLSYVAAYRFQIEDSIRATSYEPYTEYSHIFSAGYDTQITGSSSLSLPNARAKSTSWKIEGQSKQGILPDGYTQLEYLESSGTQYIQLDFGFDKTDEIDTTFYIDESYSDENKFIVCSHPFDSNKRFGLGINDRRWAIDSKGYACGYGNLNASGGLLQPVTEYTSDFRTWTYKNYVFSIPELNISKDVSSVTLDGTTENLRLFWGSSSATIGAIKRYIHKKNNVLVFDGIPAKNSSNVLGMYDTVTNTFFTNAGTGTFTAGPVCPCPTTPIYLSGVGNEVDNLFNKKTMSTQIEAQIDTSGNLSPLSGAYSMEFPCEGSTTYTIGVMCKRYTSWFRCGSSATQYAGSSIALSNVVRKSSYEPMTITTNANDNYIYIQFSAPYYYNVIPYLVIVKGNTAPLYPYEIPILQATNCGCVDLGTLTWSQNGYRFSATVPNMKYSASGWLTTSTFYAKDFEFKANGINTTIEDVGKMCANSSMFYVGVDASTAEEAQQKLSGIYLYYQRTTDTAWTAPIIHKACLTDPLLSLSSSYRDYLPDKNTTYYVYRLVEKKYLTSERSYRIASASNPNGTVFIVYSLHSDAPALCSHFIRTENSNYNQMANGTFYQGSGGSIYFCYGLPNGGTTVDEFEAFLDAAYNANEPVLLYVTTNYVEDTLIIPQINTVNGDNYIEVQTEIQPPNVSVTYRKKTQ